METNLRWHIGKEGPNADIPPYRAYFYWVEDDVLKRAEDFSESELESEIERRRRGGKPIEEFERAMSRLKRVNGK